MITHADQLELFRLVGMHLSRDITCYAFGGTAMMFYGYTDETKDVDLLFETTEDRDLFIAALTRLGYTETSPIRIYELRKARAKTAPLMYKRGDTRFDLFAEKIFQTLLSPRMRDDVAATHDFKEQHLLHVNVLQPEQIVILKSVTDRQNDFDDILTILERTKTFDWQYVMDEVGWQYAHGDGWVVFDMEETLQQLKKHLLIEEKYLTQLYALGAKPRKRSRAKIARS